MSLIYDLLGHNLPCLFAIGLRKDAEAQYFLAEICTSEQRNPLSAHGVGASLLGGERSQASLPFSHAIEHDPCPN